MKPWEFLEEYYEKKKLEAQLPQQEISDETQPTTYKVDTWTSFHHDKERIINAQISDEEIEKAANEHFEGDLMWSERIAFKLAIRWYREQLKK